MLGFNTLVGLGLSQFADRLKNEINNSPYYVKAFTPAEDFSAWLKTFSFNSEIFVVYRADCKLYITKWTDKYF